MPSFAVILAAAGSSSRFRDPHYKKVFAPLAGRPVWMYAAETLANRDDVGQTILVIAADDREYFNEKFAGNAAMLGIEVVIGGAERSDSVRKGLERVRDDISHVAIHDAARPCIAKLWIDAVFNEAAKTGAAILATPVTSTVKRASSQNQISATVPRDNLWLAQTPQVFRRDWLLQAYATVGSQSITDDSLAVERLGHPVSIVNGSPLNIKITTKEDLRFAEAALKALPRSTGFPF